MRLTLKILTTLGVFLAFTGAAYGEERDHAYRGHCREDAASLVFTEDASVCRVIDHRYDQKADQCVMLAECTPQLTQAQTQTQDAE